MPVSTLISAQSAAEHAGRTSVIVITDAPELSALFSAPAQENAPPPLVLTTTGIDDVPPEWIVFCPADDTEAEKAVDAAIRIGKPALVGVTEEPVSRTTAPTDVIDPGWPNLYGNSTACDVLFISTGPALHPVRAAANEIVRAGGSANVAHLPTISPLRDEEIIRLARTARAVVLVPGHPLARATFARLCAEVPTSTVVASPTPPTLLSAARALLGADSPEGSRIAGRPRFAERMNRLGTENAFEVLAVVNRLKAEGRDIINFAIGEPDFPTPSNVKRAGIRAIEEDKTHYGESAGLKELRDAVAAHMQKTRRIEVGPENVVITPGAKPILFNTIMAVTNPGDEVVYPSPGFPIYESLIDWVGATSVPLPLRESLDFNFDPAEFRRLITDRTRLIILNTPQNPTGGVLTEDALRIVAEVAQERDLWVLADEVYAQMVYDGEFRSIVSLPEMAERTVVVNGFSKTYSMTGWRLGYGVMPADLAARQARIETNLNSCTATFTQWAGVEALTGPQDESQAMIEEFMRRRSIIVDGLNAIPGFSCRMPKGAFYAFPNVSEACGLLGMADAKALQEHLLFEGNVAALPRTSFGRRCPDEEGEYLRFSYATAVDLIEEGLERIRRVMEKGS